MLAIMFRFHFVKNFIDASWDFVLTFQLCATQPCRLLVKEKNIYVILRELFNWEKDPSVNLATENLIQLLIGDEPEKGMENLHELEIPDDVGEKLEKSRLEAEKEVQEEMAKMAIEEKKEDTAEKWNRNNWSMIHNE